MPERHEGVMLGEGGRMITPQSESVVLRRVIRKLSNVADALGQREGTYDMQLQRRYLAQVMDDLSALEEQVREGYHRNPYTPFRIVGVIGRNVHFIAYEHDKDGKMYKHEFKGGNAEVLAVERHGKRELLITSPNGSPLWDEF